MLEIYLQNNTKIFIDKNNFITKSKFYYVMIIDNKSYKFIWELEYGTILYSPDIPQSIYQNKNYWLTPISLEKIKIYLNQLYTNKEAYAISSDYSESKIPIVFPEILKKETSQNNGLTNLQKEIIGYKVNFTFQGKTKSNKSKNLNKKN